MIIIRLIMILKHDQILIRKSDKERIYLWVSN